MIANKIKGSTFFIFAKQHQKGGKIANYYV